MEGFNSFYPDSIYENPYVPNLVFTNFQLIKSSKSQNISITNKQLIELDYRSNSFSIEFAALEYTNPHKNKYMY